MGIQRGWAQRIVWAAVLAVPGIIGASFIPPAVAEWQSQLTRYPYLTDVSPTSVQVTWSDTYSNTYGKVTWGVVGGNCATDSVKGTKLGTKFTVVNTSQYQHSITITGLSPGTRYCYRVKGGSTSSVDLLGTDVSPSFSTLPSEGPFSFLTFGDWGDTGAGFNADQAKLHSLMADSDALFAVGTGDVAYPSGTQTQYGDLLQTGTNVSSVFAPEYWRKVGAQLPFFSTPGNHGRNTTFFQIWPEPKATNEPGESYQVTTYPGSSTLGYSASQGPAIWYAFNVAGSRFYVLTTDWSDSNTGDAKGALCSVQFSTITCPDYEVEADVHWKAGRPEYEWLKSDLMAHPDQAKFAFFHYPLRSDAATEPDDVYLQNAPANPNRDNSLEKLLFDSGVRLAFNGHAHIYQRNVAPPGGLVSYVTGGGGAKLTVIAKSSPAKCSSTDAFGLGWSSSGGSYCGAAGAAPVSASKVFHFLKVTVDGTAVTVTPVNADGEVFDAQTYDLRPDSTAPSAPTSVKAMAAGGSAVVSLTWVAAADDTAVAAYDIYRADPGSSVRRYLATVAADRSEYVDATAAPFTAYTYSVDSRDLMGNTATGTAAPLDGPPTGTKVFSANADARVAQASPNTNYGTSSTLGADVDSAAQVESFLKFDVAGIDAPVTQATLRVWTTASSSDATGNGPMVYGVPDTSWGESAITWNTRPLTSGEPSDNAGALSADAMVEYDVTSLVNGNGTYALKLMPDSTDGTSFHSRNSSNSAKRPQLWVTAP